MGTLGNLESFVSSAELGSFSAASRRLGLSPGAVSKNVARLEASLGVLLFRRTTRQLTLTEAGERFLFDVRVGLSNLNTAMSNASDETGIASGTLKVSMPYAFGLDNLVPLLRGFLARYPKVVPDWSFDNRQVDLIREGFDIAIGAGFELSPGLVARKLMDLHVIAVVSPDLIPGKHYPTDIKNLAGFDGIALRSSFTGKLRSVVFRHHRGEEIGVTLNPTVILSDPEAMCRCAAAGVGLALVPMGNAYPYLCDGRLIRLFPDWYSDMGSVWIYYAGQRLLPLKSRVFIDYVVEHFQTQGLRRHFSSEAFG